MLQFYIKEIAERFKVCLLITRRNRLLQAQRRRVQELVGQTGAQFADSVQIVFR